MFRREGGAFTSEVKDLTEEVLDRSVAHPPWEAIAVSHYFLSQVRTVTKTDP